MSPSPRFRWGVLGPGTIATRAVMPAIAGSSNGVLRSIASRDRNRAEAAGRPFDVPNSHDDYQALLDDASVEGVYIALPNHLHEEWTVRAAAAGKHVLCEKPLAISAAEAERTVAACRRAGVLLMEAVMYRFHPRSRRIEALVGSGAVGEPRAIDAAFTFAYLATENYRLVPEQGGGALLDVGSYGVNACRWLAGREPTEAAAFARIDGIDWRTDALLRFPGGLAAHVLGAFDASRHQRLSIFGTEGSIEAMFPFAAWREDAVTLRLRTASGESTLSFPPADPYRLMVEQFAGAARGEEPPLLAPDDGLKTLRVLDAIRDAVKTGRVVTVGGAPSSPAAAGED